MSIKELRLILESDLLERILNGDLEAFDQLMKEYQEVVYLNVNKIIQNSQISMDLCQDIFFKIYKNLENFRFGSSLKTWIIRISINESLSWVRKNKNKMNEICFNENEYLSCEYSTENAETKIIQKEEIKMLNFAISNLNPKHGEVVILRYYEKLSLKEIANILKCSEGVVKNILQRSLKKLRKEIESN